MKKSSLVLQGRHNASTIFASMIAGTLWICLAMGNDLGSKLCPLVLFEFNGMHKKWKTRNYLHNTIYQRSFLNENPVSQETIQQNGGIEMYEWSATFKSVFNLCSFELI